MTIIDALRDQVKVLQEAVEKYRADAERLAEEMEKIASFSYTTLCVGGDDRINKLRDIARAALAAHEAQ